jgi:hypothetical protein
MTDAEYEQLLDQGREAYAEGQPRKPPHALTGERREAWIEGWELAEYDAMEGDVDEDE